MKIIEKIKEECRIYGVSWWELPDFLMIMMALINIFVMIVTYNWFSVFEDDTRYVIAFVAVEAVLVIIIGNMIVETSKKVISINRLKREFVEIASHQLRSPLSIIKWYTERMLENKASNLSSLQVDQLKIIEDANVRMLSIVNDLLNISNIESGKNTIRIEKTEVGAIARTVTEANRVLAELKKIKIEISPKSRKFFAMADLGSLKIVLENLVNNSIKYTPERGTVSISMKKENGMFVCEIKDTGPGISENEKKLLFQKFYRSKDHKNKNIQGTGLGLYICKVLIGQMKGDIWLESEKGSGSSFYFSLPLAK
jgi:signal transduction histidine kinase